MQRGLFLSALCLFVSCGSIAHAQSLPASCGDARATYKVTDAKASAFSATPPVGKARVVFIERENQMVVPFHYATVRIGMDGAWMGADYNNSYLSFDVEPGEHHLCASWQTHLEKSQKSTDVASFTAEAGKIYYFVAQITITGGDSVAPVAFSFNPVDADEGKWRLKSSKLSVWTAQ